MADDETEKLRQQIQQSQIKILRAEIAGTAPPNRKFDFFHKLNPVAYFQGLADATRSELMQLGSRPKIEQWLNEDARTVHIGGTTACGRYYHHLKQEMQQTLDGFMWPARLMVKYWLMHSPSLQATMRDENMAQQFRFIDSVIRERYPNENGELYKPQYNNQFLTEDSTGAVVPMDDASVVKLFAKRGETVNGKGEVFPHIIITTSHAQGETLADMTGITHGIEALARDSEGKPMPMAKVDSGIAPGQTLTLFACDVEKSPMLNGAELLDRINELKRIEQTGEVETDFNHISPGAKRIAKLMLKCMVEEPSLIDTKEPRCMSDVGITNEKPIRLRADAVEIAHHFQLIGYSKGGNTVSDAMRYLVSELTAKNAKGEDIFETNPDSPTLNGDGTEMNEHNVSKIVRNIAVLALASVEVGMSDYYKRHGVRRVAINSNKDLISAHSNYEDSPYDERWIIEGVDQHAGHAPQDMMGVMAANDNFPNLRGFALDDERVARRLKEFYAPNYGKAAIGHVVFLKPEAPVDGSFVASSARGSKVIIEAATGTTDAQILAFRNEITDALKRAGLLKVELVNDAKEPGKFILLCDCNLQTDKEALAKFSKAFTTLRSANDNGLVISQTIDEEIGAQISRAGRGR